MGRFREDRDVGRKFLSSKYAIFFKVCYLRKATKFFTSIRIRSLRKISPYIYIFAAPDILLLDSNKKGQVHHLSDLWA